MCYYLSAKKNHLVSENFRLTLKQHKIATSLIVQSTNKQSISVLKEWPHFSH